MTTSTCSANMRSPRFRYGGSVGSDDATRRNGENAQIYSFRVMRAVIALRNDSSAPIRLYRSQPIMKPVPRTGFKNMCQRMSWRGVATEITGRRQPVPGEVCKRATTGATSAPPSTERSWACSITSRRRVVLQSPPMVGPRVGLDGHVAAGGQCVGAADRAAEAPLTDVTRHQPNVA